MATLCRFLFTAILKRHTVIDSLIKHPVRCSNTVSNKVVEESRTSPLSHTKLEADQGPEATAPRDYKFVFPEFLPNPDPRRRDRVTEKLERRDMLRRREVVNIPEFYVGCIMAVTVSDQYAPGKKNRFVGICIQRTGCGLRASFTLRNVVDSQGIEIRYDLYSPLIQKIEVLRLEKRPDDELFYLRDAPHEHSTFPFDTEQTSLPPNAPVPINNVKVKLGPRPWHERWERKNLKGVEDLGLPQRFYDRAKHPQIAKPWEKHDLMKQYRESINDVETKEIMSEVYSGIQNMEQQKLMKRRAAQNLSPVSKSTTRGVPKK